MKRALTIIISGLVQGVSFRVSMQKQALELDLTGWVCNAPSGEVLSYCLGESQALESMQAWLEDGGPKQAEVEEVLVSFASVQELNDFTVHADLERHEFESMDL